MFTPAGGPHTRRWGGRSYRGAGLDRRPDSLWFYRSSGRFGPPRSPGRGNDTTRTSPCRRGPRPWTCPGTDCTSTRSHPLLLVSLRCISRFLFPSLLFGLLLEFPSSWKGETVAVSYRLLGSWAEEEFCIISHDWKPKLNFFQICCNAASVHMGATWRCSSRFFTNTSKSLTNKS